MRTAVHGMPRIGKSRALKWALERFWARRIGADELEATASSVRRHNWESMAAREVDFVPSNDFSLYDHVLDTAVAVGAVPGRFRPNGAGVDLDRYFVMARGGQIDGRQVAPLELTKWFDTNYHHLVPEVGPETTFGVGNLKACTELAEAAALGITTTPVLLGPFTLLLRSASEAPGFESLALLDRLTSVYTEILAELARHGASWVRLEEPALVEDRDAAELEACLRCYRRLAESPTRPRVALCTYFGHVGSAMRALGDLPVEGIGLDFCAGEENALLMEEAGGLGTKVLFAGVVNGRNVWINDLTRSLDLLERLAELSDEVVVSTSCSLLHVPIGLGAERGPEFEGRAGAEHRIDGEVRSWLAFGEEKLAELAVLGRAAREGRSAVSETLEANRSVLDARSRSVRRRDPAVRDRIAAWVDRDPRRDVPAGGRAAAQRSHVALPAVPTTTIGSFPQTSELRAARASWRAGRSADDEYRRFLKAEIDRVLELQEHVGLDVLVHGEPERDDMVRYFAEQLTGFALSDEGWVQSYGSRCVRPPILFGEVSRPANMTLEWIRYAASRTSRPVKGMLTGPLTMLRWSFVRDDQPLADTAAQLGLVVRDELADLQSGGTPVIQVDEPALREGMPLRLDDRPAYLAWATRSFRLVTSVARPETQVHTHMCYAQLGDIVDALDDLEVDVVSLEAARSHMGLVRDLENTTYQGGVGPGVYDVHSPAIPRVEEMEALLRRALAVLGPERLWVNPDCGLKTRTFDEVAAALGNMVAAAHRIRAGLGAAGSAPEGESASSATRGESQSS